MNSDIYAEQTLLNGEFIPNSEICRLAFSGFAHFTALQVRDRKIKGMDLHLERLRNASMTLFGKAVPDEIVRSYVRTALEKGPADLSLTVTVYSPEGEFTSASMNIEPKVLIRTSAPSNGPDGPLKLAAIHHQRPLANIKHVGEIGKTYYLHQAIRQGFDDAVFIDNNNRISEGTIWNMAFWDGETIVWPKADMLKGTMMAMVQRQLTKLDIPQRTEPVTPEGLSELKGAVVMNSWTPGINVSEISSHKFPHSNELSALLHNAYENEPAEDV
ncbi:putative Branched-chain amino acid aminotransferase/4-amino-4-deoxychorismate lyase [Vibrio nigripulchritudo SFn27]|uniref:Putative Branched-chain amino acid aminotransferase/4-amino-4-deoxychorismate lyase n=1 Tax=Vibrio nigripulchritudo TaxID=28173 RepID=U4KG61_9VIBR|nr:aminotransferase class IV family protein [Vibrio nigripulchritudo]CCN80643.1 putative Branched-chain amino acid aminotransferase/4-amino-4-deoxychorismate lyase [Vibrio nigripulchritudo BLFn1]CCN90542.1 putative Branched-chain amino acid aminotransferase/4-amino-4-deoxychorismate lyase [Vibrio nigripulchritudo SFn27]CCN93520.1 putative Branched-chain amino acid aminotransferase/4-amino-4-deoxychorismate lyase [Vibrio nigripulchritudo ENn2]CCO41816.1 putative Branched-chain amino acid aminotr